MLSYHKRTNQALGIFNETDTDAGLRAYQTRLLYTETLAPEFWTQKIDECLGRIQSLERTIKVGKISNLTQAMKQIEDLGAMSEYASSQVEILTNG